MCAISLVFILLTIIFSPLLSENIIKADNLFSSSYFLDFENPLFSMVTIDNSSFIQAKINECMVTAEPGVAQIPFYSTNILIPDGCHIKEIQISEQKFTDYSNNINDYDLLPAQEETPFSGIQKSLELKKNQSWYDLDTFYPKESYISMGVSYMKGYPVETIHLFPIRHNPSEKLLWFYGRLKITVTFSYEESTLTASSNQFFRKQNSDANQVKELVLNSEMVDSYQIGEDSSIEDQKSILDSSSNDNTILEDSYIGGLCNASDTYEYVIVTNNDLSDTTGYPNNWSDLIFHRQQHDFLSGCIVTIEEINSCFDYYNETTIFNDSASHLREFCKANDKLSELLVGRIPVWNAEMVSNVIQKIIWYDNCNNETFLRSSGFLGGDLGWTSTSKQYMEEIRVGNGSFSEYDGFEEWNTEFPDYEINTLGRYYDADYSTESDAVNAWKNAINNNELCLISHLDHGSYSNTLSLGSGSTLSNSNFFLGTSQACLSGRYTSGTSGASTFLAESEDQGAFAMVLNTGYGYGSSSSTAGKSQLQHKIFWDYFYANQTTSFDNWRLGQAMQYTKDMFSSYIDSYSHVYSYVWYSWNLFGDPAQKIRLNAIENTAPVVVSASPTNASINVSINQFSLSVFVYDLNGNKLNWTIETSPDIGNSSGLNESYGEKTCSINELDYITEYTWFVNVSDGTFWTNETFTFTSEIDLNNNKPVIGIPIPVNNSSSIDVWMQNVSSFIQDPDGDNFSYSIEGLYISDSINISQSNGTKTANCTTPLPFDTNITWFVNVSDHRTYSVNEFFVFTTRQQYIPGIPFGFNAVTVNRTAISLNWTKNSSTDKTIVERNSIPSWDIGEGIVVYNGSNNTMVDNSLLPGINYYYQVWGWNATDTVISDNFSSINSVTDNNSFVSFSNSNPVNASINCSLNLTWSIDLSDADGDYFDWNISINSIYNSSTHDVNGSKTILLTNLSYYTVYTIWVNATDGFNQTNEWFQFKTKLPTDFDAPRISSVSINSTNSLEDSTSYPWKHISCNVIDNFRVANVSMNVTFADNSTSNLTLTQIDNTNTWVLNTNLSFMGNSSVIFFATDLNGNMNHESIELFSLNSSINMNSEHDSLDYGNLPTDIYSLEFNVFNISGQFFNYSVVTIPNIGSASGSFSDNGSIIIPVSDISYETIYEWRITFEYDITNFVSTFTFTTEDAPDDNGNLGGSGSSSGFLPPETPAESEGDDNLPPETPFSPQGLANVEMGKMQTYTVSSWDKNNDTIRFQMDWGDGRMSDWSDFVSSNESVNFTHIFADDINLNIRVRAQDEYGMNSSWSEPYTIYVSLENETKKENDMLDVIVEINNETGEISFSHDFFNSSLENVSIIWDFGDGFISEGISPKHQYIEPGEYIVTVTITNKDGNVTTKTFTVSIPEPQQQIDTKMMESEESTQSMPWIMVLVGIIASIAGVFVVLKFQGH